VGRAMRRGESRRTSQSCRRCCTRPFNRRSGYLLRQLAAIPIVSAIEQSESSLFGVCGTL
jgi:hypothetical protein